MKKQKIWLLSIALLIFLSACQMVPSGIRPVPYEGGFINIHEPWPMQDMYWQQSAQFVTAQGEQTFLLSAYFRAEESLVVALTPTGYEFFRVHWTADSFDVVGSEQLPDARLPMRVIADMQLALWPLASIQEQLQGLSLAEEFEPQWQRTLRDSRGREVLLIRAEQAPLLADEIHIEHESYQLTIRTIEREFMGSVDD